MFWALLFALLLSVFGGESPYLVPHMNKHIKKHVTDPVRKDTILFVLKQVKKEKKSRVKENKKLAKQMNKLFASRASTQQQFDELIDKIDQRSKTLKDSNLKARAAISKNILPEEWKNMQPGLKKDLRKLDKRINKSFNKLDKQLSKLNKKIESSIVDEEKRSNAIESLSQYREFLKSKKGNLLEVPLSDNSILVDYDTSNKEYEKFQSELLDGLIDILKAQVVFHNTMVKNTTEKEWKKIDGKMKVF